jgi:hypothetical protein
MRCFPDALLVTYDGRMKSKLLRDADMLEELPTPAPTKPLRFLLRKAAERQEQQIVFPLFVSLLIKAIHKDAYIRRKTARRCRATLRLVVCGGARSARDPQTGSDIIEFDPSHVPENWVAKGRYR